MTAETVDVDVDVERFGEPTPCGHCHSMAVATQLGTFHTDRHGQLVSWLCPGVDQRGQARMTLATTQPTELHTQAARSVAPSTERGQVASDDAARPDQPWPPRPSTWSQHSGAVGHRNPAG